MLSSHMLYSHVILCYIHKYYDLPENRKSHGTRLPLCFNDAEAPVDPFFVATCIPAGRGPKCRCQKPNTSEHQPH